jgi:uncharacterized delta-60 repeat protein
MKSIISIFLLVLFVNSYSQVTEEWVARYDGPERGSDVPYSIAVDASGNVYVTGNSWGGITYSDYTTVKYNSSGVEQWVQRYDGPGSGDDYANSIAVDASGNVYVTGESYGSGSSSDYATIKYNASGVQQWVQRYNYAGAEDGANSVAVDASGNVYVTGWSIQGAAWYDYATIKYNSSGVQQWVQRYNGPASDIDVATSIGIDVSGNVCVTGYSFGIGTGYDYATIKYNSSGVQQWVQRYQGLGHHDYAYSIAVDASGNVYVTGQAGGTLNDYTTIKYNSSGVEQWVQRYNGPANVNDNANSIAVDESGNAYVTGESTGIGSGADYATVKYSSSGVQLWVQRYNGPGNSGDHAYSIAVDASGNVYVTGESVGVGWYTDYCTIKYNSEGVQQWVQRYNPGNGGNHANSIAVDASSNVYVTGRSPGINGNDYVTIKYSQQVGIEPISTEIPKELKFYQNYPNPFNPVTRIKFGLPEKSFVKLIVYDVLGREVGELINKDLKAGEYNVEWNASMLASGIYFYRLETDKYTETRKMVLIK